MSLIHRHKRSKCQFSGILTLDRQLLEDDGKKNDCETLEPEDKKKQANISSSISSSQGREKNTVDD